MGLDPGAAAAEEHYRRVCELERMDEGDLRALLARDPSNAARYVESAARQGLVEAQLRWGRMLLAGEGASADAAAALRWFRKAAAAGSAEAMNMVGRCLELGLGAEADLKAAAEAYAAAARAGSAWGEYNLANLAFDGRGAPRDLSAAVAGYRRAAAAGHGGAMNLLARCLEEGWGVSRDPAQARRWYARSAQAGSFRGGFNQGLLLVEEGELEAGAAAIEAACRAAPPAARPGLMAELRRRRGAVFAALAERVASLAPA